MQPSPSKARIPASASRFLRTLAGLGIAVAAVLAVVSAPVAALAAGKCAQPVTTGEGPKANDCVFILKAAIGGEVCDLCVCDLDNNKAKSTTDALRCLKKAVGQNIALNCPACVGPTTTTTTIFAPPESSTSTTSTSSTSSTTTIPTRCGSNGDCGALQAQGFRCNPHTETCEKPCTRDNQCKDFYECDKPSGYCRESALLF